MNCQEVRENLSAYLDGELDKKSAKDLAAHLLTCTDCRRECEQLQMVNALWQELPEIEPPPEFMRGLNEKLAATAATTDTHKVPIWQRARKVAQQPWYKFAAVAAVFGMAIGISTLWDGENANIINHPQVTKSPNYQEGKPHVVKQGDTDPVAPEIQEQQVNNQNTSESVEQPAEGKKGEQQAAPQTNQQVAINNTTPSTPSAPSAQTESVIKSGAANIAANISTLSIKIGVPSKDIGVANQKVSEIAAKYNAQLSEKNNEFDLKFPLGTDISLLLDEFKSIGEVSTVPIKDLTKEYRAQIKELEQKKTELQTQLESDSLKDIDQVQQELNDVQNEINKKYDEIKELSKYVNIVVKVGS